MAQEPDQKYTQNPDKLPERVDTIIVGAGIAGLYCAWRLLNTDPSQKIAVVDRLNRTGGRLDTDLIKIQEKDGTSGTVRDEEGGMRFNYQMKELMTLNGSLKLCDQIVPFPMSPTSGPNNNRFYVRGQGFTADQAAADPYIWSRFYDLADDEKGKNPVAIITHVYHKIVEYNINNGIYKHKHPPTKPKGPPANPTPEYWQQFRLEFKWNGTKMNEWQLWGLLREMGYTEECIKMLSETLGFEGPFLSLANAGEAFQILEDFPANPTYFTFKEGYSTLPNALVKAIQKAGGQIFLGSMS